VHQEWICTRTERLEKECRSVEADANRQCDNYNPQ